MSQDAKSIRNTTILSRYLQGETLRTIAISTSLTEERVRQIVRQAGLTVADRGKAAREGDRHRESLPIEPHTNENDEGSRT
jgi:hypothetical protein